MGTILFRHRIKARNMDNGKFRGKGIKFGQVMDLIIHVPDKQTMPGCFRNNPDRNLVFGNTAEQAVLNISFLIMHIGQQPVKQGIEVILRKFVLFIAPENLFLAE